MNKNKVKNSKERNDLQMLLGVLAGVLSLILFCQCWSFLNRRSLQTEQQTDQTALSQAVIRENEHVEEKEKADGVKSDQSENTKVQKDDEQKIRVLIRTSGFASELHDQIVLESNGTLLVSGSKEMEIRAGEQFTVMPASEFFSDGVITVTVKEEGQKISVPSISRSQGVPEYSGKMEIYQKDGQLYLVNTVDLETYLRSVVPSEMPSSYEQEALKAQAVCARTYAIRQIRENRLEGFEADVDDSVSFQVYNNISCQEESDQAVQDTEGMILVWNGEPINAYFFSTSCGYTSTDEVWNQETTEKYLKSVYLGEEQRSLETEEAFASFITGDEKTYESEEAWYRWKVTLPVNYLNERIAKFQIGQLKSLEIRKRAESGAVECLAIHGTDGETTLENEYEIRQVFSAKGYPIHKNDGTVSLQMDLLPSAYFTCEPEKEQDSLSGYTFYGGGYGHGVGMSQNGANHMAEQGMKYEEILKFFFADVKLQNISA